VDQGADGSLGRTNVCLQGRGRADRARSAGSAESTAIAKDSIPDPQEQFVRGVSVEQGIRIDFNEHS
jgi:hypothetical protein